MIPIMRGITLTHQLLNGLLAKRADLDNNGTKDTNDEVTASISIRKEKKKRRHRRYVDEH